MKRWVLKTKTQEERRIRFDQMALERGGLCLTEILPNHQRTKVKWQCVDGHIFELEYSRVKQNHWCSVCTTSMGERVCKYVFEKHFGVEFKRVFPDWLRNKNGRKLQLDGYNESLKIAFEYQGQQHFNKFELYEKNNSNLEIRQEYDQLKVDTCKNNNIILYVIPFRKNVSDVLSDVINLLSAKRELFVLPEVFGKNSQLTRLTEIAKSKGGKLLDTQYIGITETYNWECGKGHTWKARAINIVVGHWCRYCTNNIKLTIEIAQDIAKERGGVLISNEYINSSTPLTWQCSEGHEWTTALTNVKNLKTWCPNCNTKRIAKNRKRDTWNRFKSANAPGPGRRHCQ